MTANSVVKAGKHVLELLFDGRLRLVLVKPQSEQSEGLSCQVHVSGLASVFKLTLAYLRLVVVAPASTELH